MSYSTMQFNCVIATTDPAVPLSMQILLDDQEIFHSTHVQTSIKFQRDMPDEPGDHTLTFRLSGKLPEHTQIDQQGNIIQDACIKLSDLSFEDINISTLLDKTVAYMHDTNGTQAMNKHKFFEEMGCNGDVILTFKTPIYLWILENM